MLIGVGAWLMYEAWKNPTPTPLANAKAAVSSATGPSTSASSAPTTAVA